MQELSTILLQLFEESAVAAVCAYAMWLQHRSSHGAVGKLRDEISHLQRTISELGGQIEALVAIQKKRGDGDE